MNKVDEFYKRKTQWQQFYGSFIDRLFSLIPLHTKIVQQVTSKQMTSV